MKVEEHILGFGIHEYLVEDWDHAMEMKMFNNLELKRDHEEH